jgi:hypothetical protein
MTFLFPALDTLRLALGGGDLLPAEVLAAPATASFDAGGRVAVETAAKVERKAVAGLGRLGVTVVKRHVGPPEELSCWFQALPVAREPGVPQLSAQAPVLFELESATDLPGIVGEMLRLGNDRQSIRRLTAAAADDRVLLRVIGPPYYTLLRAIDGGPSSRVRAYLEVAPRVWVQVGYGHPNAAAIGVAEGQSLLLRPERDWLYLPDAPFQDVYDLLNVRLPASPVAWREAESPEKLTVPLRLAAGNAADLPELWVLRGRAVEQLDAFVRDADDRLTQRLKFAVATGPDGNTAVVLRVTASKLDPPVLPLPDAAGYKPYYKMPNLFLPAGTRLHPPLRRDAVRKLLADDTDRVVWLAADSSAGGGAFTPETLPEDSFRPLTDWVEYVLETSHEPLQAWLDASRFDFEGFVCSDTAGPKPKPPDDKEARGKKKGRAEDGDAPLAPTGGGKGAAKKPDAPTASGLPVAPATPEVKPPSAWYLRRQELESEFLDIDGPLDAPARVTLWPELGRANAGYGDVPDAALSYANALWNADPGHEARVLGEWLRAELPELPLPAGPGDLDAALAADNPTAGEARAAAVLFLHLAAQSPVPRGLSERLPAVQAFLQAHETKLPVRVVWLASARAAALAGADTLGLARVRDRILQRLLEEGTRPERDIPFFLRSAGLKDSERLRQVRDKSLDLHKQVRAWAERSLDIAAKKGQSDQFASLGYLDLLFAFGMAKLGEGDAARRLVESARGVLEAFRPTDERGLAARFLFKAFRSRVEQAIAGKPHAGPLDPALLEELEALHARGKPPAKADNPFGIAHYAISRLRDQSQVLEPQEKLDPYHEYMKETDDLRKALTELPRLKDANALARQTRELFRNGVGGRVTPESRFLVLVNALPLAGRVGEAFTVELLGLVPETMRAVAAVSTPPADLPDKQGKLLERALMLAANYDRREIVQQLVDQFVGHVKEIKGDEPRYKLINVVASRGLKSLRKLGLRDEIDRMLQRLQDVVLGGRTPQRMREEMVGKPDVWAKALQSLLHLAGGWLTYGLSEQAAPTLALARAELTGQGFALAPKDFTPLAQAYVAALGQGPAEAGVARVAELFQKMDPARVANSFTSAKFYSRFHLNLVEQVVLALVNDDFALGPAGRRWLDEDEYLLRRRVHADIRKQLAAGGL